MPSRLFARKIDQILNSTIKSCYLKGDIQLFNTHQHQRAAFTRGNTKRLHWVFVHYLNFLKLRAATATIELYFCIGMHK
jgi:hypothetical protein